MLHALFLLVWPLVIYVSYKFIMLNINQLEKDNKLGLNLFKILQFCPYLYGHFYHKSFKSVISLRFC